MKRILAVLLVVVFVALTAGCGAAPRVHTCTIVELYLHDEDANDGVVQRVWRTTVELENGERTILCGKFGAATGEVFKLTWDPVSTCWTAAQ